ncbi:MAG: helix-turn-helix transcriptional regulator [Acetobacteraceae bacterium]|nr:helix-turn-helix transcriptional regulator [Acetobacteraceae bacterium]MBV8589936.1 helix-turn-helix transcriptional regulator [Acetobacteraceae bacterium]
MGEQAPREEQQRGPNPVDVHVGSRIKIRREFLGFSQEHLAERLGIAYQQVQKYERGVNRISASRLLALSQVLDVPISFFFDDMPDNPLRTEDRLDHWEPLELARAYWRISDSGVRHRVLELIKSMAPPDPEQQEPQELATVP